MAEYYRFRSIDSLLGEHKELEKQTIYFASPEELNDPMEGLRDIVWDGDKIVWTNLFKHYVFCLNRSYFLLNVTRDPRKFDVADIPIFERWDEILTPIEKSLFDDVWGIFCNLSYIQEMIEALANTTRKIRYREIVGYFRHIQIYDLLDKIRKTYIDHGLISDSQIHPSPVYSLLPSGEPDINMHLFLNMIRRTELTGEWDDLDVTLQITEERYDEIKLAVEYHTRMDSLEELEGINHTLFWHDFPKVYLEQLGRLLWGEWYTACFTGSYHNSSMWAKYADGHKGACLIFESVENNHSNNLKLNNKTKYGSITTTFWETNYADSPGEIDFFRTISFRLTTSALMELWYTDQDGNLSECAAYIGSDSDEADWQKRYWNNLRRDVTFKTKDWEYEQEYRLFIYDIFSQLNEKDDRQFTYDFDSLKGIIFGIRTSTEDIIKIIEIIEKKKECAGNNQSDFSYFQAYYSAKDGAIRKRKIRLQ